MKTLPIVKPTAEQLLLISQSRLGVEVIRGAAGSGKTSTALLRLKSLSFMMEERRARQGDPRPVRILVLTFNRTLKGYVTALAEAQLATTKSIITIDTFAKWAMSHVGHRKILTEDQRDAYLAAQMHGTKLTSGYLSKEVDYLLGRFLPADIDQYLTKERSGRGLAPRVDRDAREKILSNVVRPYNKWKIDNGYSDWNDLAVAMYTAKSSANVDIVIVDEAQDFSANQLRAISAHLEPEHAVTFVIDTVQRIYARGFTWQETGYDIRPNRYHSLAANHRNTVPIAKFAAGVLEGVVADDDGALPNLTAATRDGPPPVVLKGKYSRQMTWATDYIKANINLKNESVAFLQPAGGRFLKDIKAHLRNEGLDFADITRNDEWPAGQVNIAISTFHSAKGLEFDHVFILGMSTVNTHDEDEDAGDQTLVMRRLFAVAIARARETVVVGYKPSEASFLMQFLGKGTFREVSV